MHGQIAVGRPVDEPQTIDLHGLVDFGWRRWRLIALVAAIIVVSTFVVLLTLTPRYTATAEILLDLRSQKSAGFDILSAETVTDTAAVDSQISILRSFSLLQRVVDQQKLVSDPEFGPAADARQPPWYSFILDMFRGPPAEDAAQGEQVGIPDDVRTTILKLRDALDVTRVGRTYVLQVQLTSQDKEKAARIANAVADAFIVDQLEARFDAARRASTWLSERLQALREDLRKSEEAVEKFRSQNNLVSTSTGTVNEQQLSEINASLVTARAEAAEKQAKYQQAQRIIAEGGNIQAVPDVVRSTVIVNLRAQQAEVTRREADLVSRYGERHPLVVNVRAERREIDRQISAEVNRIITNLKNDYDVAQSRVDSLTQSVAIVSGQTGSDNALAVRLRELERDATANRTLYESFLGQSKLAAEQSTFEAREARIITPATTPIAPSFPRKSLFLAIAGVFGLAFGIGLAGLLDMLNSGFNSPRQVEDLLGLPVLASIEDVQRVELKEATDTAPIAEFLLAKPLSRFSESIRSLRAGIQMSDVDHPPKVVQVTSATPGEGKTSLAISLAVSAATSGKKVVLIDCDLRRPTASKLFGLDQHVGLVDLLTQTTSQEGVMHRDKASGVYVLGAGSHSQNPPDLLGSMRMQQLLDHLRQGFDLIVVDTPPIGPVIDSSVISQVVDKVVFVVRWGSTSRELAQQAMGQIVGERKICGVVLNRIKSRHAPKYGRYGYYSSAYNAYYVE
jgi:exopolysaccharide transport family protein